MTNERRKTISGTPDEISEVADAPLEHLDHTDVQVHKQSRAKDDTKATEGTTRRNSKTKKTTAKSAGTKLSRGKLVRSDVAPMKSAGTPANTQATHVEPDDVQEKEVASTQKRPDAIPVHPADACDNGRVSSAQTEASTEVLILFHEECIPTVHTFTNVLWQVPITTLTIFKQKVPHNCIPTLQTFHHALCQLSITTLTIFNG